MITPRTYTIPNDLQEKIDSILQTKFLLSLEESEHIAKCVERLSEYYIRMPGSKTPWAEEWCQIAYLAYYLPLNEIRARAVIQEGIKFHFFDSIEKLQDFGSGLGAATYSLSEITQQTHIEDSMSAQRLHQLLGGQGAWTSSIQKSKSDSLLIMSYSLTELEELPKEALEFDSLMIIEPATKEQGRKLLKLREKLFEEGFHIWAPCTHQNLCPLLHQSKNDWCHDRVHFDQPTWFSKLEELLPMKNRTLTFSYLLAKKSKPRHPSEIARITGDMLNEKGKTRQLVCRGEDREFLTWMHRSDEPQEIPRGALIEWPKEFTLKSNEVRVKGPLFPYQP